jgi:hypothetical protein
VIVEDENESQGLIHDGYDVVENRSCLISFAKPRDCIPWVDSAQGMQSVGFNVFTAASSCGDLP